MSKPARSPSRAAVAPAPIVTTAPMVETLEFEALYPLTGAAAEPLFVEFEREILSQIVKTFSTPAAPKPLGHFVRHRYDANGELMSNDAV